MAHTHTMGEGINPEIFNPKVLGQMKRCQGMVDTFPEVQIPLILGVRYNFELVLRAIIGAVVIYPLLQLDQRFAQCPSSQRSIV